MDFSWKNLSPAYDVAQLTGHQKQADQFIDSMDPASPYKGLEGALGQASADAKALSALQWQRQMEGLGKALGYVNHSQNALNNVYGHSAAPGASLPQGMPQHQGLPTGQAGAGLAAYFNGPAQQATPQQGPAPMQSQAPGGPVPPMPTITQQGLSAALPTGTQPRFPIPMSAPALGPVEARSGRGHF